MLGVARQGERGQVLAKINVRRSAELSPTNKHGNTHM